MMRLAIDMCHVHIVCSASALDNACSAGPMGGFADLLGGAADPMRGSADLFFCFHGAWNV